MKYEVGDKVEIRRDLEVDRTYNGVLFTEGMDKHREEIATIIKKNIFSYYLDVDKGNYIWTDDMFCEKETINRDIEDKEKIKKIIKDLIDLL